AGDIKEKTGPKDLVTIADVEAERRLGPVLTDLLPGSVVIGEEAASADPTVLNRLAGEAPVWLIDSVDGTLNFSEGDPRFCVMVPLARRVATRP
ncbi:MAG: inositol monophosphatase, partial [Alphaproteobacteria bacterium]|nr:inositol monophosphatase [Alphaproteobacteria bacterium]